MHTQILHAEPLAQPTPEELELLCHEFVVFHKMEQIVHRSRFRNLISAGITLSLCGTVGMLLQCIFVMACSDLRMRVSGTTGMFLLQTSGLFLIMTVLWAVGAVKVFVHKRHKTTLLQIFEKSINQ